MTSKHPADQLFDLCTGQGATPEQITRFAPFMQSLPVTLDAQRVLAERGVITWEDASHAVLICVVNRNGAKALSEEAAFFARACLGLDGSTLALTQRMHGLASQTEFTYPKSLTTLTNRRRDAMSFLSSVLVSLDEYPCASKSKARRAADEAEAHVMLVLERSQLDPEERVECYRDLTERFAGAMAVFDKYEPSLSLEQRFNIMVTAVAANAYSRVYEEQKPSSIYDLVEPRLVPDLYRGIPVSVSPGSPKVERTALVIARIMIDIEEQGNWKETLIETEGEAAMEAELAPW